MPSNHPSSLLPPANHALPASAATKQIDAFLKGFWEIVPRKLIRWVLAAGVSRCPDASGASSAARGARAARSTTPRSWVPPSACLPTRPPTTSPLTACPPTTSPARSIFSDHELELLISGLPEIDVDDLRANTEYTGACSACSLSLAEALLCAHSKLLPSLGTQARHLPTHPALLLRVSACPRSPPRARPRCPPAAPAGFTAAAPVVQWFWEVVRDLDKQDLALLVQFVTGEATA